MFLLMYLYGNIQRIDKSARDRKTREIFKYTNMYNIQHTTYDIIVEYVVYVVTNTNNN